MALNLDKERMEEGINTIIKVANTDIIADIEALAIAIKSDGDNDMKDKLLDVCRKFEDSYNDTMKPSIDKTVEAFQGVYDIAELLEKTDVGDILTVDSSFDTKAIDPSAVPL
jgi:hypothetical protein